MGGKSKAPKGPKWKDLLAKMDVFIGQNQDLFKEALQFGKDQFSQQQEWVDRLSNYGLDQAGKLGDRATAFDKASGKTIDTLKGVADQYGKTNQAEYGTNKAISKGITDAILPGIQGQAELGQTLRDRYQNQAIPYEDQYLKQLRGWDTTGRREARAAEAVGDIAMSSEAARESELRRLESYGIDPSQTRSAALDSRIQAQNALAKANAANLARRSVEAEGLQLGKSAIDIANNSAAFGSDLSQGAAGQGATAAQIAAAPGQAYLSNLGNLGNFQQGIAQLQQSGSQLGYNMAQGAGQFGMTGLGAGATQQNTASQYGSGVYGQGSGMLGQSGQMLNSGYQTGGQLNANDIQRVAANNANSFGSQLGSLIGAIGPAVLGGPMGAAFGGMMGAGATAGMSAASGMLSAVPGTYRPGALYNEGGYVDPSMSQSGGAIPDDVPARLTGGEYVLDEPTVQYHGLKALKKLQEQAHAGMGIPVRGSSKKKKAA